MIKTFEPGALVVYTSNSGDSHNAQVVRRGAREGTTVIRLKPLPKWWSKPGSDCMTCYTSQLKERTTPP